MRVMIALGTDAVEVELAAARVVLEGVVRRKWCWRRDWRLQSW